MYKNFKEFREKIHPYWGKANYTNNMDLLKFVLKKEEKEEDKLDGNKKC